MKRFNISHQYDIDLFSCSLYDAKNETLAQICSFLNPIRLKAADKIGVKSEMKLSSYYVLYYYYVELSSKLLSLCELEKNEKKLLELLEIYFSRLFTFDDFKEIAEKYGLVPVSAMPDAAHHHKSDAAYVAQNRLRLGIRQLLNGEKTKKEIIAEITGILSDGFGTPPESFNFTFINYCDELETLENLTPKGFFNNFCETKLDDYVLINTSDENSKDIVSNQLKGGEEVVVCADTRHQKNQMLGILDTDFIDSSDMFGYDYTLSKAEKLELKIIKPTAYLTLDGVAFENGGPVRFKAQDVHASETGADGHYTMSSKWFDEYVLSALINKKYL